MKLWHWGLIALALIALALVAARQVFAVQIGEAAFKRAVAENVGRDPSADLPDGLHLYVCGSGSPLPDAARAGPCIGVLAGDRAFIFDVGAGSIRRLTRMGFPTGRTEKLYLSHLHSDHFDGIGELMIGAWVGGSRSAPLPVAGPEGVAEVMNGFNAAYRIDSTYRMAHHGPGVANPDGYGLAPEVIDLPAGPGSRAVLLDEGDLLITAFLVNHSPIEPAYGFRIDYKGRSAVISGDTVYSENLVAVSEGADILFHEALHPEMVAAMSSAAAEAGAAPLSKVFSDILNYHASPVEAARAAQSAGAGRLVLYHTVPPLPSKLLYPYFLDGTGEAFSGPVDIAEDGQLYSLPVSGGAPKPKNALN
ncbi:metallo-beta-lactamase family protein [Hyphomonas neptunium ATCC 15444]|uniref:Metallo-beta-lactamase family protein n=2 Tax=Hyphomonas TaxID=85 RepID=Q0C2N3_HYPNA|nr:MULTISPECIES: MBL fold metallo-hydrolase [Hyphomonas]ABI77823.1 metallo-beta-lactamase family protein [Hyphomonas neptunium ATCC 15444]KCZ95757.1 ribonuclease Z [Hyphomonas hirschiana VP5]